MSLDPLSLLFHLNALPKSDLLLESRTGDLERERDRGSLLLSSRVSELVRRGLLERLRRFSGSGDRRGERDRDFVFVMFVLCNDATERKK